MTLTIWPWCARDTRAGTMRAIDATQDRVERIAQHESDIIERWRGRGLDEAQIKQNLHWFYVWSGRQTYKVPA